MPETIASGTILDRIMEVKRKEVSAAKQATPLLQVQQRTSSAEPSRNFTGALRTGAPMHVIAEVKKASPSKGVFRPDFDPMSSLRQYEDSAASAISILTDRDFFQGSPDTLQSARKVTTKPCLRKDFIYDEYQVWEARSWGADAVLLIATILPTERLTQLLRLTEELGMAALVEAHTESELGAALESGASVVGINNRDLKTFYADLETTLRLREQIPARVTVVSESGIETREHVRRLEEAGVNAVLVGESLIWSDDAGAKIDELLGRNQYVT